MDMDEFYRLLAEMKDGPPPKSTEIPLINENISLEDLTKKANSIVDACKRMQEILHDPKNRQDTDENT